MVSNPNGTGKVAMIAPVPAVLVAGEDHKCIATGLPGERVHHPETTPGHLEASWGKYGNGALGKLNSWIKTLIMCFFLGVKTSLVLLFPTLLGFSTISHSWRPSRNDSFQRIKTSDVLHRQ